MAFWRLYYHLVWATKNREPVIVEALEASLYSYLVHKASELGVFVYAANGWVDHMHLIVAIPPALAVADVAKRLKGASSHEMNRAHGVQTAFAWQRGYGALSLGERQRPDAEAYVRRQKAHHSEQTTLAWLERTMEFDEGPGRPGRTEGPLGQGLHEAGAAYDWQGDAPF